MLLVSYAEKILYTLHITTTLSDFAEATNNIGVILRVTIYIHITATQPKLKEDNDNNAERLSFASILPYSFQPHYQILIRTMTAPYW